MLPEFLARKNSQTISIETKFVINNAETNNIECENDDGTEAAQSSNQKWLPSNKVLKKDYQKIVNSVSADSRLHECNGHVNAAVSTSQMNSSETGIGKNNVFNFQEACSPLIRLKRNSLGGTALHEQKNNFSTDRNVSTGSHLLIADAFCCQNASINSEIIPPPAVFNPPSCQNVPIRKITTTV